MDSSRYETKGNHTLHPFVDRSFLIDPRNAGFISKALQEAQRRCEELEEALNSRSQVVEMLQQEVSSADQQKQVDSLVVWSFLSGYFRGPVIRNWS